MKYRLTFKDPGFHGEDQTGKQFDDTSLPEALLDWFAFQENVCLEWNSRDDTMIVIRPDTAAWDPNDNEAALLEEALAINTPAHLNALGVLTRSEIMEVPGSNSSLYEIRLYSDGHHYCSCPSMKFERGLDDDKHCKHIRATQFTQGLEWSITRDDDDGRNYENEIRFHDWGASGADVTSAPDA